MSAIFFRPASWRFGLWIGLLILAAGCNDEHQKTAGGGVQSSQLHAEFDRDSRNNEDNSLGVKAKWVEEQAGKAKPDNPGSFQQLDANNYHLTKSPLRFAPDLADELVRRNPGVRSADVLLTETNAYVAVVLDGHDPAAESHPDMMSHQVTSKGGVGLFGIDKGNARINWSDPGGLTTSLSIRMKSEVLAMTREGVQRVFVSANPNFVQRVRFYKQEGQKGVDLSAYLNEFNTLIQRVFPNDGNTRR
ncbi:hypothetical protein [Paenibacillus piri]|uniref:Sporulation protein n=1 Tax=Paenibacillus piri TaxID=2547395 RepID=A0A4R5KX84_9BACL|nr:hypothetical protein [Paenibacillus piri]TDF99610.1 hypothetical protein E1757_07190 [Paenibacillus piri]